MSTATVIRTRAAVFRGAGVPQEVAEVELGPLGPDQVIVDVRAVGVCGTDLHMVTGDWVRPRPMVLGHECAGVVTHVGSEVAGIAVGDHVAVCWSAPCGRCASCQQDAPQRCLPARTAVAAGTMPDGTTRIALAGETVYRMATTGAFAEAVLIAAAAAVPIPETLPFEQAALLGCAALCGTGAALNVAQIDGTTDVLVVGAGGVGQFAVQGARIAGAQRIVAVDPSPGRRELALAIGATAAIAPDQLAAEEPFPLAIDAFGSPATIQSTIQATRPGGRVVVVGLPEAGARMELDPTELTLREKTLTGSYYGAAHPRAGLEHLLDLARDGSLLLEPLIGPRYPLDQINEAIAQAQSASSGRVILTPSRGGAGASPRVRDR